MLDTAQLAPIDIGRVNDRYFVNGLAIGTMPEAIADVSIEEKTRLGSLAYFMKGIRALREQKVYRFHIETDAASFLRGIFFDRGCTDQFLGRFRKIHA